jgi:thiamine-phosphate pyrophosphorylase
LYLVTPDWDDTARLVAATEEALAAGAAMVQYRHKSATRELRLEQGAALRALCRRYRRPFIVNDHVALCLTLEADGVHVGGTDVTVREARRALGPGRIVGASCYGDLARAHEAAAQGASYLAFGGFYPSLVKQYDFRTDPDLVRTARAELALPLVVIGGMTPARAQPLVERGADLVAAISAVYGAPEVRLAVHEFDVLFARQAEPDQKSNGA